jgi:hypothetical protein
MELSTLGLAGIGVTVTLAGLASLGLEGGGGLLPVGVVALPAMIGLLVAWGIHRWPRPDRHPDITVLRRYGNPQEVVRAIEEEVGDGRRVLRIGLGGKAGTGLRISPRRAGLWVLAHVPLPREVLLTASWLLYPTSDVGDRWAFLHLDSIVLAYRSEALPPGDSASGEACAVLVDRHGFKVEVPSTEVGITCLLAEILSRVPWALDRFDEATQRAWKDDREQVITAADRRRAEAQAEGWPGLGEQRVQKDAAD